MSKKAIIAFLSSAVLVASVLLLVFGGEKIASYVNRFSTGSWWKSPSESAANISECRLETVSYRIGDIDSDFGFPKDELEKALVEAEAVWEVGAGRELFEGRTNGRIKVNLIFDERQGNTVALKEMLEAIDSEEERFEALKAEYEKELAIFSPLEEEYSDLSSRYEPLRADLESTVSLYERKKYSYDSEVSEWNRKGGAPKPDYDRLKKDRNDLEILYRQIKAKELELRTIEVRLNALVDEYNSAAGRLNTIAGILNRMSRSLNQEIESFNRFQGEREEFVTGIYRESGSEKVIDVYQFYDRNELVTILAHELGHALGIDHATNPSSIMYPKVRKQGNVVTEEDLSLLYASCPK